MFGGHGVYCDDVFFAIVADEALYIKVDDENRTLCEEAGLARFSFMKKGKECQMSYYKVPEEALENREKLHYWARQGHEAGLRSKPT